MEELTLVDAVSTVGFPIAVSCFLLWDRVKNNAKQIAVQEKQNLLLSELRILIKTLVK